MTEPLIITGPSKSRMEECVAKYYRMPIEGLRKTNRQDVRASNAKTAMLGIYHEMTGLHNGIVAADMGYKRDMVRYHTARYKVWKQDYPEFKDQVDKLKEMILDDPADE